MLLRRNEDRELTALNRGGEVKKVRLDFGWVMQPPKPAGEDGEGEAAEVAEPEWRCSMLDAQVRLHRQPITLAWPCRPLDPMAFLDVPKFPAPSPPPTTLPPSLTLVTHDMPCACLLQDL